MRRQGGNSVNLTPIQFKIAFKKLFSVDFFTFQNQNCSPDFENILNVHTNNIRKFQDPIPTKNR